MSKNEQSSETKILEKMIKELSGIDFPEELCCPITTDLMLDPVSTECGHTFSKEALVDWVETSHDSCPICRNILKNIKTFKKNNDATNKIRSFLLEQLRESTNLSDKIKLSNALYILRGEYHLILDQDEVLVLNEEFEALFHAIKDNLPNVYQNINCNALSASGRNALHAAALAGNKEAFEYFRFKKRDDFSFSIHDADSKGETPFILAVKSGTMNVLSLGDSYDWNQYGPVSYHPFYDRFLVEEMIQNTIFRGDGDYYFPRFKNVGFYESPLVLSVLHNQPTSCQYLIRLHKKRYLSLFFRAEHAEKDIYVALMLAAKLGRTIAFKAIVATMDQSGMDMSQYLRGSFRCRILKKACNEEQIDICHYIMVERNELWAENYSFIWERLEHGAYSFFMKLVEGGCTDVARKMLNTLSERKLSQKHLGEGVLVAAERGYTGMCNLLISTGVPVDFCLGDGETAIYKAAQHGHLDTFKWLLIAGSDLRINRISSVLKIESLLPNEARSEFTVSKSDMNFWVSAKCKRYIKDNNRRVKRYRHTLPLSNISTLRSKSEAILALLTFVQESSLKNLSAVNHYRGFLTGREIFNTIIQPYIELSGFDYTEHDPEHIFSLWFDTCVRDMTTDASEERVLVVK